MVSLEEIKTSDIEQGEAYMRTKQSIAKLMSDAERQYVTEYTQKVTPGGVARHVPADGAGGPQDHIKVQKLSEGPNQGNLGNSIGEPLRSAPGIHCKTLGVLHPLFPPEPYPLRLRRVAFAPHH